MGLSFAAPSPTLHRRVLLTVLIATALGLSVSASAATLSTGAHTLITQDHVPTAVVAAQPAAQALTPAKSLQLGLNLPPRNEDQLDALLAQIYDPASPNFHHYLSAQEFTARFAPSQADYEKVVAWAKASGFTVIGTPANRRLVQISAPVDAINRALHLTVRQYQHPSENRLFFAPDREPTLSLDVPLLHITGLDDYVRPFTHLRRPEANVAALSTQAASSGSGPSGYFLPSDIRAAYYGKGSLTGAGQTVAIFSYDGYKSSDLSLFYSKTGTSQSVPVKNVLVNGYSGVCDGGDGSGTTTCDDGEQILDIVNAIGVAPGLTQVLFYEGSSATDILNQIAADNTAKSISSSWGGGDFGSVDDPIYKEFQAQGQTFVNASGDDGSYTTSTFAAPSLDPNITNVGGTDLTTNGAGGSWASETAWSDSSGGYLKQAGYATPAYQKLTGVINSRNKGSTTYRNDPDIALEANFDNVTADNGSFEGGYGGTSFAAPRLAGLIALANQQAVANGAGTVGFLNTTLYTLGSGSNAASVFHDVSSGSNGKFTAVPGYDLVTGWGSPIGPAFISALLAK